MSAAARLGSLIGAAGAACLMAMTGGGPPGWVTAGLCASLLVLAGAVLFWPSETPARRLCRLIQAWRTPAPGARTGPEPVPGAPASLDEAGG